jgi:hypothetical protein
MIMTKYFYAEVRYANREYSKSKWSVANFIYDERSKTGDNTTLQDFIDDLEICVEDGVYSEYDKESAKEITKQRFDFFQSL